MQKFFKLSAEKMRAICGIAESRIFPVVTIENNTVGGKGFDAFVTLDSGDGWFKGAYVGKLEMFAARGEFVTEADYLAQCDAEASDVVAIASYANGAHVGLSINGQFVLSFPARLVDGVIPDVDEAEWILTGAEVRAACDRFNLGVTFAAINAACRAIHEAQRYAGPKVSLAKPEAPECVARLVNVTQESNADVMARTVAVVRANRITREYVESCHPESIESRLLPIMPPEVVTALAMGSEDARLAAEYLAAKDGDTGPEWEFFGYATRNGATWSVWHYADASGFVYQVTESEDAPTGDGGYRELLAVLKLRQLTMCDGFPGSLVACEMKRALDAEQARADAARNLARGN